MLGSVGLHLVVKISGKPIAPIFKGQAIQKSEGLNYTAAEVEYYPTVLMLSLSDRDVHCRCTVAHTDH
jgi:hypothetical protein